jgi:His/Glu/Gln/Arg/opine family amino acid ABC transporter permease subunit
MDALWNTLVIKFPDIVTGTILTLVFFLVCGVLAMVIAIPAGLGRLSRFTVIRAVSTFYVETIRGTPLLFQLLVWSFGVQIVVVSLFGFSADQFIFQILTNLNSNNLYPKDISLAPIFFGMIGLGVNYGAYMAEVIRAGVQSVEHGQTEAALSLGLSRAQTTRFIILPQALRIMIPPLTNNFITLVQDTAFLQIIGVYELSLVIQTAVQATSSPIVRWGLYTVALAIYFVICYSLALISRRAERRTQRTMAGAH